MYKSVRYAILFFFLITVACRSVAQTQTDEQLAVQYMMDKDYEKASQIFERLFDNDPSQYNYYNYLNCLLELNDIKKAEKTVKKLIRQNPSDLRYVVDLGFVYSRAGDASKAEDQYSDAIRKLKPDRQQVIDVSNAFLMKRETEFAIKTIEKGRQLMPGAYPFSLEMANLYEQLQQYPQMFGELLDLLAFDFNYLTSVENRLQSTLANDPNGSKNEAFRTMLLKRIQKFPDLSFYSEMMLWYSIQQKDFESAFAQAKSLDRRYNETGQRVYQVASMASANSDYDVALEAYDYLIKKGKETGFYVPSRMEMLDAKFHKITTSYTFTNDQLQQLESEYIAALNELGKSPMTIPMLRNLAHLQAFYLNKEDSAIDVLNQAIQLGAVNPDAQAECKLELADIYLFSGEQWEALLLYSQVDKAFKNQSIGDEARYRNAKLSFYIGEFGWAKAQLDVLKAATSKFIANDAMELSLLISDNTNADSTTTQLAMYARADMLFFRNKDNLALQTLDSILTLYPSHPIDDEVLYKKMEIKMKEGRFDDADSLLRSIVRLYPYDILADDALFKLAELNEQQLKNTAKAMDYYQELMTKYPGSVFTVEARKRFRALRGDH